MLCNDDDEVGIFTSKVKKKSGETLPIDFDWVWAPGIDNLNTESDSPPTCRSPEICWLQHIESQTGLCWLCRI